MVTEPVLNVMVAEYLSRGLSRSLKIPESRVRVYNRRGVKSRQPDVRVIDMFGVTIVVQGKIENIDGAIEDCKDTLKNGLADLCFAVSYPRKLANLMDINEIQSVFEKTSLKISMVKLPGQLTLEGWPEDSIRDLGVITPSEIFELLQNESIYDEIVGVESTESITRQISEALDTLVQLPTNTKKSIHSRVSSLLGIELKTSDK